MALFISKKEIAFQREEKMKRAAELLLLKEKRDAELIIANSALVAQNEEKEKRAEELIVANAKLAFQNEEKKKRAEELIMVNRELVFKNEEKEKLAEELVVASVKLAFQNKEREKRAAELIIANKELAFQNTEREKRAAELIIANGELVFQNQEKEKLAAELLIANAELIFQNAEKEKRAAELTAANKELAQFAYIASHDLQEPLRTVSNYMQVFEEDFGARMDDNARKYLHAVTNATSRMSTLIRSLLSFSRLGHNKKLVYVDSKKIVDDVIADLDTMIRNSRAVIEVAPLPQLNAYEVEIRQLFQNLLINAIKFQKKDTCPHIRIQAKKDAAGWEFSVGDNGIGIDPTHFERVFDIFQRLHTREYEGSGIGLANCKKIVHLHQGEIWVESCLGSGTTFRFTIPLLTI